MSKPQSDICSKCFVINNKLRCMTCCHKTDEWVKQCIAEKGMMILHECDNFKEAQKSESQSKLV